MSVGWIPEYSATCPAQSSSNIDELVPIWDLDSNGNGRGDYGESGREENAMAKCRIHNEISLSCSCRFILRNNFILL